MLRETSEAVKFSKTLFFFIQIGILSKRVFPIVDTRGMGLCSEMNGAFKNLGILVM